jgi:hypothetical protein
LAFIGGGWQEEEGISWPDLNTTPLFCTPARYILLLVIALAHSHCKVIAYFFVASNLQTGHFSHFYIKGFSSFINDGETFITTFNK